MKQPIKIQVLKVVETTKKKQYHKTLGTGGINSPMSPSSLNFVNCVYVSIYFSSKKNFIFLLILKKTKKKLDLYRTLLLSLEYT